MTRFTPTAGQLERLDDIRVAVEGKPGKKKKKGWRSNVDLPKLAALLGLPVPPPEPEELDWKYFPYPEREDEDDFECRPGIDYTDGPSTDPEDTEEVLTEDGWVTRPANRRAYTDDFIKRRDEYELQVDARNKAAKAAVDAERTDYEEKREASAAAVKQWKADNAALLDALNDWEGYFWRLDEPEEAAKQDIEDAREQRETIFSTLLGLKRFLKQPVTESSIGDLVADAYSTWCELAQETQDNADNMQESFPTKSDEWGELANTLENFTQPDVPDKFKDVRIAYYVGRYGTGKDARNTQAIDDVQTVIDYLEELEGDEDAEALASDLEDTKGEAEGLSFPGWGG